MENLGEILNRVRARQAVGKRPDVMLDPAAYDEEELDRCPICSGRGFVVGEGVHLGHKEFGQARQCECQRDSEEQSRHGRLREYSKMGPLAGMTFDNLAEAGPPENGMDESFSNVRARSMAFTEEPVGWLTLAGPHGCGKTHTAASIANRLIENGTPVLFVLVPELLDDLRRTFAPNSAVSYSDLYEQVVEAPVLVLDDLGAASPSSWAMEKMRQIFNRRAIDRAPTVITVAEELSSIDPYIASRLNRVGLGRVLHIRGSVGSRFGHLGEVPEPLLRTMTLESFVTRGHAMRIEHQNALKAAHTAATRWASEPNGWLSICGGTGVGKTHLAVGIAGDLMRSRRPVFFAFVPELMDQLRAAYDASATASHEHTFAEVKNAPTLILDGMGEERQTDWAWDKIYQLIVHRDNHRMPTVITSTANPRKLAGPIASRMQDVSAGAIVYLDCPDYRRGHSPKRTKPAGKHSGASRFSPPSN